MRFKVILSVSPDLGSVLPISYQYELAACVNRLMTGNEAAYSQWLHLNQLSHEDNLRQKLYSISNLYIPKIHVEGDRLKILTPRIQFWISFTHEVGTEEYVRECMLGQEVVIGDRLSRVRLQIEKIDPVASVEFSETMEYMALAPMVVIGMRPNNSLEFLDPTNDYFARFLVDDLIERYERLSRSPYTGSREYSFELLSPPKRKGVLVRPYTPQQQKIIGYMFKFRLTMDVSLQRFAYDLGMGDKINFGFGYVELINKQP